MPFQAVIKYLSSSNFFKILSKRLKVHCAEYEYMNMVPLNCQAIYALVLYYVFVDEETEAEKSS